MFLRMLSYPQLIYFRQTVFRKLTYFKLPFIISSLVDFKLFICCKTCEFNKYSNGDWAYIDLNTLNISQKICMARLSNAKNSYIFFRIFVWRSVQCFSFSSLTLFNKKNVQMEEKLFRRENKNVYRLTQQIESF